MNKKEKVVIIPPAKKEMVNLVKLSYHYRDWIKNILSGGTVKDFKFLKAKTRWNGTIFIPKIEVDKADSYLNIIINESRYCRIVVVV
jgi:hypothetical protein